MTVLYRMRVSIRLVIKTKLIVFAIYTIYWCMFLGSSLYIGWLTDNLFLNIFLRRCTLGIYNYRWCIFGMWGIVILLLGGRVSFQWMWGNWCKCCDDSNQFFIEIHITPCRGKVLATLCHFQHCRASPSLISSSFKSLT